MNIDDNTLHIGFTMPAKNVFKEDKLDYERLEHLIFSSAVLLKMMDQAIIELEAGTQTGNVDVEAITKIVDGLRAAYRDSKLTVDGEYQFASYMVGNEAGKFRVRIMIDDLSDEDVC